MSKSRVGIASLVALFASFPVLADTGVDEKINLFIKPYSDAVAGAVFSSFPVAGVDIPFVLVWLIVAATVFTVYFRFINIRAFKHGFELVRGDYHDPEAAGEVTHFQARISPPSFEQVTDRIGFRQPVLSKWIPRSSRGMTFLIRHASETSAANGTISPGSF